jgi:hypothetical protein
VPPRSGAEPRARSRQGLTPTVGSSGVAREITRLAADVPWATDLTVGVPKITRLTTGAPWSTPAEHHGSGARSTQSAAQAVFQRDCSHWKGLPQPDFARTPSVAGSWRGRLERPTRRTSSVLLRTHRGMKSRSVSRAGSIEPARACFREARPPRKPCFRGAFRGPEPPLTHLREEESNTPRPRCLPSRGNQSSVDDRPANRAPPRDRL